MSPELISRAEGAVGYVFQDKQLLERALTLSSKSATNNEELEFFGDAILQFVVSEALYKKGGDEGALTERRKAIVSKEGLEGVSRSLGLPELLVRGVGDTNNKKAVSSVYEAMVAAIYLDGGMQVAKSFILRTADFAGRFAIVNYKGILKEKKEKSDPGFDIKKAYDTGVESPNGGSKRWQKVLTVNGKQYTGFGATKDEAEQECARLALAEYSQNS